MSESETVAGVSPQALPEALQGQIPEEHAERLIEDLRTQSPAAISSLMEQSKIFIKGDDNTIGHDNVTIKIQGERGETLARILREAWSESQVLHQLFEPTSDFVGRQSEIEEIVEALRDGISVSISGMSGIGKTQLAMYVARQVRDRYPDAQLYVAMDGTLETPRSPAAALEKCIRSFIGPEETLPQNIDELKGRYDNLLRDKRVLVVLDNAADSKQVSNLMPPSGCAMLVTSINAIYLGGKSRSFQLQEFTPDDARQLLLNAVTNIDRDIADKICELCGYMPLAISAAAGFLHESNMDPARYAKHLESKRGDRFDNFDPENVKAQSVKAAFNLSYDRLSEEAQTVFRKLAVFQSSFNPEGEEYVCEDQNQWHLCTLERRSLVLSALIFDKSRRYRLLHLGRLFAESKLAEEERYVAAKRHAEHYKEVLRDIGKMYGEGGESLRKALILFDKEADNIRTGRSWAELNCDRDEEAARLCIAYAVSGECLFNLREYPKERLKSLQISLDCARRLGLKSEECEQLGSTGRAYVELGDFQTAAQYFDEQLKLARDLGDRAAQGHALNSLGNAYLRISDLNSAIKLYEDALSISREIGDRQNEGRALNNLGDAYRHAGDFRRAVDFYTQQLEIAREIGDIRNEGNALNSLGDAYSNLGETRRAIKYHEESLQIAQEIGTKLGKMNILNNLGNASLALGEAHRAIEFYQQSFELSREIGYSFGEYMTLNNLGEAQIDAGLLSGVTEKLESALDHFRKFPSQRGEGNALNNLGKAYNELGEPRRAIEYQEQALDIARQLGSKHAEAHVLNDVGEACAALGEFTRAIGLYDTSMSIFNEIGDLRGVCVTLNNLGKAHHALGDIKRAREFHELARDKFHEVGDQRGESMALNNLGKDYADVGEARRALELFEQALSVARAINNGGCEAEALYSMSLAFEQLQERPQAIAQAEAALKLFEQMKHPRAALVREQLSLWQGTLN
jgi:tetratricopeptide (TPR) repeat protein